MVRFYVVTDPPAVRVDREHGGDCDAKLLEGEQDYINGFRPRELFEQYTLKERNLTNSA